MCRKVATGPFTLDLSICRTNHLLVCTVTGIAPFVSYVRTLYRDWEGGISPMPGNPKLYCLQGASRSWGLRFRDGFRGDSNQAARVKHRTKVDRTCAEAHWRDE